MNNIEKGLKKFEAKVKSHIKDGVDGFVDLQYSQATSRVPEDTGELLKSIEKEKRGYEGSVSVSAEHAFWIEFGTGIHAEEERGGSEAKKIPWSYYSEEYGWVTTYGQPAQPYWYPSLDVSRDYFRSYFNKRW